MASAPTSAPQPLTSNRRPFSENVIARRSYKDVARFSQHGVALLTPWPRSPFRTSSSTTRAPLSKKEAVVLLESLMPPELLRDSSPWVQLLSERSQSRLRRLLQANGQSRRIRWPHHGLLSGEPP